MEDGKSPYEQVVVELARSMTALAKRAAILSEHATAGEAQRLTAVVDQLVAINGDLERRYPHSLPDELLSEGAED